MKKTSFGTRKFIASLLCANMFLMNTPLGVLASEISGVTPTGNTYNIEAAKTSGDTGFRHYDKFNLTQGDIANLIYKDGYSKFVNLVNNQVNINGIVNTMKGNNFYNGHAIFVSPNGIVIGASGVLNVGSLSLLTPSSDKFNAFKTAYESGNLAGYQYDATDYKNLITDSHGNVVVNGKIISRGDVNIYGSYVTVKGTAADKAGIIAGVQGQDVVFDDVAAAKNVFNTLVSNNITDTTNFALSNGKIKIVADSTKNATVEIENANIAANDVGIQAVAKSVKKVDTAAIDSYNSSQNNNNNNNNNNDNNNSGTGNNNVGGSNSNNNNNEQTDSTTGKKIPDSFKGVADKATATITIKDSNISADKVSITSDATNKTETYIQLISPIWENWIKLLGGDLLLRILAKMDDDIVLPDGIPYTSVEAVKNYFSDKAYQNLDGAVASGTVSIEDSNIIAKNSINIEANSSATTKISTGELDSHPLFFYGLGAKADSDVSISGSTLKTASSGTIDINAFTEISDKIKYDSSKFLTISQKPQESGSSGNNNNNNNNNNDGNNNNSSNTNDSNNSTGSSENSTDNSGSSNSGNNNNNQQQNTVSAYNLTLLNNSIISSANVEVSDSTIETKDLNVSAIDFNTSEIELKNVSYNGEGADKTGIAAAFLINHTDTNSNVAIKDGSKVKAGNNVSLIAQNINWFDNYVETEVKAKNQTYTVKNKVDTTFSPTYTIKAYEWLNKKFLGKATNKIGDVLDKLHLEISGSAIWNNEHNVSTAAIDGSTINAKNVNIDSNMVDFALNSAEATATAGNKFSAGTAIIVSDQNNTNNAKITNGAQVTAESGIDVKATTQIPMNPMELKIGQKLSNGDVDSNKKLDLFLGASFDQSADSVTGWDTEFLHTKLKDIFSKDGIALIKSGIGNDPVKFVRNNKISLKGLFNNKAKSEGTGETIGVAGSVVANSITNDTNAFIDGAKVVVTNGDINVNAANSVANFNGAGKVDFLIEEINGFIKGNSASEEITSKFGIGGSVLVENFTNNANAYINNSTAKTAEGDINVKSASEEAYVNVVVTGGKTSTLAVDGSVNVQRINGKTKAYITNSKDTNEIVADNVNVNAGTAKIKPKKSGTGEGADPIELDENTNQLSVADEREVKDSVLNVSILGTNAQTEGSGVSVGASVDVENSRRETVAYISNSTVTATKNASVIASNNAKKIDVIMAGAFAGGVSTNRTTQENANSNPTTEDDNTPQRMQNAGNWMDEIDNAPDDAQDVMNLNNLFNENDPNTEGAENATQNRDNIANQDNIVNNDGETQNGATSNNSANNPGNNNGSMADGTSNPSNSSKNFSLALAGAVSVFNDNSVVKSEIINSTINVGEKLNTTATRDKFVLNISGGLAKAGNIGGGAGVNVYRDKGLSSAKIDAASIIFTSSQAKALNVIANNTRNIVNVAVGVGIAKGEKSSFKTAVGGSFNTNILKDTTSALIKNNTTVENGENVSGDIDTKVEAKANTKAWDVGGDLASTSSGNNDKFSMGAAIAGNMDLLEQTVKAEISGSTLENIKALTINSELVQDMNTIGVAGAITTGSSSKFSFNIDGALALEMLKNNVTSLLKDSTVTASGDVKVDAKSDIKGQALTGGVEFSNTQNGFGVGIGSVITIDDSAISAKADGATIKQSNSIEVKADSKDDRKFLAVNLGIQNGTGTSVTITANGIVEVLKSTVDAAVLGESDLKSNGAININSIYNNSNQGIAVFAGKSGQGLAVGANVIASYYGNTITSEIAKESKITQAGSVRVDANTSETLNYIPVTVGIASGKGNGVGADVVVNIIKNETNAKVYGNVATTGNFVVKALDETTIKERGGVLEWSSGTVGIGATVYYDYLNKNVTAEVKGNTVSSGAMTVQASSVNSLGGTKKTDGTWDVSEMSKEASAYGKGFAQGSSFADWNMAYSLAHGDTVSTSGSVMVRKLDNIVKANVEGVNLGKEDNYSGSLTVYANDYTIMNMIAGEFSASGKVGIGANSIIVLGKSDVQALLTGGKQYLTGALSVDANIEKLAHTVIVGGSGSSKVAINGSAYVNKINDNILSSIIASEIKAKSVDVNATQKNDSLGVDVSATGSGTASIGGIVYLNLFEDTTKAIVGDNSKNRTKIETTEDVKVKADSDYESREYLLSVGASGTVGVSGLGVSNVMDSTIEAGVYNSDVTSTAGKIDVEADRGFNRIAGSGKTAFFRNWFKSTDAYTKQGSYEDSNGVKQRVGITETNLGDMSKTDLGDMAPTVGTISVAASGTVGASGTIVVNKTRGSLTAKIDNSTVNSVNGTTAKAIQDFVNFDAVAAVAASGTVSLNGVGVINNLSETITAQINNTESQGGLITTDARSNMNLNQLVVSGQGAGTGAAIGVVVDKNDINDKVYSYITGGTKTSYGAVANSAHNIMINNILVAGSGVGAGVSAQAIPIINNFTGETISKIEDATINGGDIKLSSFDNLDNLSAVVGVSAAGTGANLSGYAVRNKLDNKSKAYIDNAKINTAGAININADSVVDTTNAIFSAGISGVGVSLLANVISNTIISEVEGYIKNSTITEAGDIKIIANVNEATNKYRYDQMTNTTGNVSFAGEGAALATNVIYTNYSNKVKTYIDNTSSQKIGDITLDANSERRLDNTNIGIGGAAVGAAVAVNAISTNLDTNTLSYIDAKDKTMNNVGAIKINSRDDSDIKNTMGTIQVAGLGAAAGVGLDMTWNNTITKSEILSAATGQINAVSATLKSNSLLEYDKSNVGVSLGMIGLAGDYVLLKSGKRADDFSTSEKDSKIKDVIDKVDSQYVPKTPIASGVKTGSFADINGNLTTSGDISVGAESKMKGRGNNNELNLSNTTVTVALGAGSVGVRDVDLASNTNAGIIGGTVKATNGDISVNAKNTSNVKIKNVNVNVSLVSFSGGSAMYHNTSNTVAQIGSEENKTDVTSGGNINVTTESTSNSEINATFVTATGANLVAVDLAENVDTNNAAALVNGETNITATNGTLELHSTVNTDLQSTKKTYRFSGADLVNISKNDVTVNTISRAIIENVTGNINTKNLDIITDYGKMNALSNTNFITATIAGVAAVNSSGSFMNAAFTSGINSPSGLVLKNTGATNITTALEQNNGTTGLTSKGKIANVDVAGVKFVAVSSANAQNRASANTVLNSNDFTSGSLNVNSNLRTSSIADANAKKIDLAIGVNAVSATANDNSTMNLSVSGKNTVIGNAVINGNHIANTSADLSDFGFSLLARGSETKIKTELIAATNANISGKFNVSSMLINLNTTRESNVSKSSGGGGIISVSNPSVTNTLTGNSILNIKDLVTDKKQGLNDWEINNTSTNIFDVIASDTSGGFISVNSEGIHTTFNTSTEINIDSTEPGSDSATNINSDSNVKLGVKNVAVVNESTSTHGGGFVAVATNNVNNSYTSNAKLTIANSKINATKNIELSAESDIHTKTDDYVDYVGGAGGFVAVDNLKITNTLNQSNNIDIKNSTLSANKSLIVKELTNSKFRQRIESKGKGFVSVPRGYNYLYANNTNTLSVDNTSKLFAGDNLQLNQDSSDNLEVRTRSDARNFAGKPSAYSYLYNNITNTINNSGTIEAGNLVDINFMNASNYSLEQHAYSECHASIAASNEGGVLSRKINNTLTVNSDAKIKSGKDVEISYKGGSGSSNSYIGYKNVSYMAFGIPITKSGNSYNYDLVRDSKLNLHGDIIAGEGNNKYMLIDRYGEVDMSTLTGFYPDDYIVTKQEIVPGDAIKSRSLASIKIELDNVNKTINEVNEEIISVGNKIVDLNGKIDAITAIKAELQTLIDNGAILIESTPDSSGDSAFNTKINDDLKAVLVKTNNNEEDRITEAQYNKIGTDYMAELSDIYIYNNGHDNDIKSTPTIVEFMSKDSYGLTESQINNIATNYGTADAADYIVSPANKITQAQYNTISIDFENAKNQNSALTISEFLNTNKATYGISDAQISNISANYGTENAGRNIICEANQITQANYDAISSGYQTAKASNPDLTISEFLNKYDLKDSQINNIRAHYGTDDAVANIVGNGEGQITQAKYDEISGAYLAKVKEIDIWNNGHPESEQKTAPTMSAFLNAKQNPSDSVYNLSNEQISKISTEFDAVYGENGRLKTSQSGEFVIYTNSLGTYVAATAPSGSGDAQSCKELTDLQTKIDQITAQVKPYKEQKATAENNLIVLNENRNVLQGRYNEVLNTDASEYEKRQGEYTVIFSDIYPRNAHILVDGTDNRFITGNGTFDIAANSLKVENYSTRTLIFNDVIIDSSASKGGLFINGKDHADFIGNGTNQAVSGFEAYNYLYGIAGHKSFADLTRNGAHYIGRGSENSGITINNYYDTNHPFISEFTIPNPTQSPNIYITGDVYTKHDLKLWTESGSAGIISTEPVQSNLTSIVVPNGLFLYYTTKNDDNNPIVIKDNDYIYVGSSILIGSALTEGDSAKRDIIINGTLKSGYTDGKIIITDDMIKPENLIKDPTSGDVNMINLGLDSGNVSFYQNDTVSHGNIKAIFKDGQIYLYNVPGRGNSDTSIVRLDGKNVSVSDNTDISIVNGLKNITINNETNTQLNIGNIANKQEVGFVQWSTSAGGQAISASDTAKHITINKTDHANTQISSNGKLVLNGVINNNIISNSEDYHRESGILNITANNGLDIKKQTIVVDNVNEIVDSIKSYGNTTITVNGGQSDINGQINTYGTLNIANNSNDKLNVIGNIINDAVIAYRGAELGEVSILSGTTNISNNGNGTLNISGVIEEKEGNIAVNSNSQTNISGKINDAKGNISITSNGLNLKNENTSSTAAIKTDKGDITITNTGNSMNLADSIENKEGNISISNSGTTATISGTITDEKGNISVTNSGDNGIEFTSTSKVTNANGNTTITNNKGKLIVADGAEIKNTGSGDIKVENTGEKFTISGIIKRIGDAIGNIFVNNSGTDELEIASTGKVENSKGNIDIQNSNDGDLNIVGLVHDNNGNVSIKNSDDGGINISGTVTSDKGTTIVENTSDDGILITTTGKIHNEDGDISVSNTGADGINIQGSIKADKQNITVTNKDSDITIGEYASDNDNYVQAVAGNITINQTNGDILNNITDPDASAKHQNYDVANPNHSYKTLIAAGNNLTINAKDGNIGTTTHSNPGLSIDAGTRDYTESINVNVGGSVVAKAINENDTDKRLINIRAKESDITVKDITSDGNVILTAADWKQADTRPTPKDEAYFTGYSIYSSASGNTPAVTGQNISIISSDNIGTSDRKLVYMQDTLNAPNSSVSLESENDMNVTAKANSDNETKLYQIISKHGTIDLDLESDGAIKEITSGKGLKVTQKAQNLTIIDLGMPVSSQGSTTPFDDMLNPHDDLVYGVDPLSPSKSVIPNYINIKALDAINNPERGDSNLKIYNAYVQGNHGENTQYYPNGTRLADVTLMADNIYANSAKAPDSTVSTVANPNGFKQPDKTYTLADFGFGDEDNVVLNSGQVVDTHAVLEAHGINAYGEGEPLSLDILGVDKDIVNDLITNPNRNLYEEQQSVATTPDKFKNPNDEIVYYNTDYRAKNAVISVNDYVDTNRGVVFDTLYADNAYVNTKDTNLDVTNGYITNFAELRNNDKIAVVDNDFRRIVTPANIQLYTQKTGSFALGLNGTINMSTTAPTVYNNPYMLVNGYHSAWNFVNREFKENKDLIDNTKMSVNLERFNYNEPQKRVSERFDTTTDTGLVSDFEILDISTTGASVKNDKKLKCGKNTKITIKFDDVNITVNAKVVKIEGNKAGLEFIDMPEDVANKILYRYMQRANSMKSNLTTSL